MFKPGDGNNNVDRLKAQPKGGGDFRVLLLKSDKHTERGVVSSGTFLSPLLVYVHREAAGCNMMRQHYFTGPLNKNKDVKLLFVVCAFSTQFTQTILVPNMCRLLCR